MFKDKEYMKEIIYHLGIIQLTIENLNKFNLYDINIYSEDFFCKLLNIIYKFDLKNLNIKDKNIVSIDLGDIQRKICYQVTSTNSSTKIKNTIKKFEKYELYNDYNELFILLLTNKKKYSTAFTTNNKYTFSKTNIIDIKDIISEIETKSIKEIEIITNFIRENTQLFSKLNINPSLPKVENKINNIILSLKTKALEKYNLKINLIESIILELDNKWHFNSEFEITDYMKTIYNASLFFNSINEYEMNELTKFITIHLNVSTKYATNMFIRHHDSKYIIDSYMLENIVRILKSLKNILKSEINIILSSGFGDSKKILENDSIIVSISNDNKNDHKLIILDTDKEKVIEPEFCLGGISEKVKNIKSKVYEKNLFIFAQANSYIYIWQPRISYVPIIICRDNEEDISDYEIFIDNNTLVIIAITFENTILVWKVINNQSFIFQQLKIDTSGYLLINIDGKNKLIGNNRYSKEIYKYDFINNQIYIYFTIPDLYNKIVSLSYHPIKNYIAFTYAEKSKETYGQTEYDKIIQYDIDNKNAFFYEKFENHFIEKISYELENNNIYLTIYDRDGAGGNYSPLIKSWQEISDKNFTLTYLYNEYPKEKNNFFSHMKLFKNNIYVNSTEEPNIINKLKEDKEIFFYQLYKGYVVNSILCNLIEN